MLCLPGSRFKAFLFIDFYKLTVNKMLLHNKTKLSLLRMVLVSAGGFCAITAGVAQAAIPTMNYSCPTGIELHIQEGGYAYLNGKAAQLKIFNDNYFEVKNQHVSVEVMSNPDGMRTVSYTGKRGAHGICSAMPDTKPAATSAAKTSTEQPKNMPAYCKGEAAGQFNTKPVYIQIGKTAKTISGYAIKGSGDLGNQGKKSFQCNFDPAGNLESFQSPGKG